MKLLKQNKQIKQAVDADEELDEEEIEKEVEEEDEETDVEEDEEEEQKPLKSVAPLFQKKDKAKEETKEDGTIEPAILPLGNGDLRPGWNIWCSGKKVFSTDELMVLVASRLFSATKKD
jgi:hypothetical protein